MKTYRRYGLAGLLWVAGIGVAAAAPRLAEFGEEIADAVERVMPSVVVVRTENQEYQLARDYFSRRIFRVPSGRRAGIGSGSILDTEGHILTCYHVVRQVDEVEVALHDGTAYPATLVGYDEASDLAVLRIEPDPERPLQPITAADSDQVRVGQFAIAVGSPFSLDSSVTLGIVSQKGRSVGLLPYEDFIQTDASINPGNSGGPLVNVQGEMIGMNNAIKTAGPFATGNIGIGFAVPANLAVEIAQALIAKGDYQPPRIGVSLAELDAPTALRLVNRPAAVVINEVLAGTPAAAAGLVAGDIIIEVNQRPVGRMLEVQRAVLHSQARRDIRLKVLRGGEPREVLLRASRTP
ncbi:MAG: trypsin-like peptidase domain-containing protein [Candidatus Marinimicrobia bacterium]|nr:trypsin-like peptidase domain-containing protein [Candidatus Neomarinimicrobiota bacterium]